MSKNQNEQPTSTRGIIARMEVAFYGRETER